MAYFWHVISCSALRLVFNRGFLYSWKSRPSSDWRNPTILVYSALWPWTSLSIYFKFAPVFNGSFQWMFFSSIKEINRWISKGISNTYLKVIIKKNWHSQNFDFLSLKKSCPSQFFGSSNSRRYNWSLKLFATN